MKKTLTILASALLIGTSVAAVRNSLGESTAIAEKDAGIQKLQASLSTNQSTVKAPAMEENSFIKTISFDLTGIPFNNINDEGYWEWDEALQEDIWHPVYCIAEAEISESECDQIIRVRNAKWAEDGLILDNEARHIYVNSYTDDYGVINATFHCEYMNGIDADHPLNIDYSYLNSIDYGTNSFTIELGNIWDVNLDDFLVELTDSNQSMKITSIDYQLTKLNAERVTQTNDGSLVGYCLRTVESDFLNIPRDEYACVYKIATEKESITIPETINASGRDYHVLSVGLTEFAFGYHYFNAWGEFETFESPNLKKVIVPESLELVNYDGEYCGFEELYLPGNAKPYLRFDNPVPMHLDNRQAYLDYVVADSEIAQYLVRDYPQDWAVINVTTPGNWAQTYIEQAGEDWAAFDWIKINGEINSTDLTHMQNLKYVERMDLSGASFEVLPTDFLPDSRLTIEEIVLPKTVKTIERYALRDRRNLSKINLENVENIGNRSFQSSGVKDINLSNIKNVDEYAFEFSSLTSIIWPNDTKDLNLSNGAFRETQLQSINIPNGLSYIPYDCFAVSRALTEVTIPQSVKFIDTFAFSSCPLLSEITIPEGVSEMDEAVFSSCSSLKSVSLPSTLTRIGDNTFADCPELVSIKCAAVMPPEAGRDLATNMNTFKATLYVLPFVKDLYRNATGWNNFMLVDDLWEQVNKLYVNRPLEIEIGSEYNDLLSNNPIVEIRSDGSNAGEINEASRIGQLTISGNGTFSAGNFIIDSNLNQREDYDDNSSHAYSATMINTADNMRADAVTTILRLKDHNDRSFWHFISFPYDVKISDIIPGENVHWVIRAYDASARANGDFDNTWKDLDNDYVLQAGKGYIIASNDPTYRWWNYVDKTFTVPALNNANKNKIFATGDVKVTLEEIPADLVQNRSWNFIGNPYPAYYQLNTLKNFTAPVTIWRGSSYAAYSPVDDDVILYPNEAFFLQCPTDQTSLTFAAAGRLHASEAYTNDFNLETGLHAPQFIPMDGRNVFNFNVEGVNSADRTRVVINPESELSYQMSCDAPKFFAETQSGIEIYTSDGQTQYSINERPLNDGTVTMGIKSLQGEYTISLNGKYNSEYTVLLTDMISGNVVDLTSEDYTFIVNEDYQGDRFVITICTEVTGINQISSLIGAEENVTVTAINGVTLYKGQLSGFNTPNAGIYIINAGGNSYKAFLK